MVGKLEVRCVRLKAGLPSPARLPVRGRPGRVRVWRRQWGWIPLGRGRYKRLLRGISALRQLAGFRRGLARCRRFPKFRDRSANPLANFSPRDVGRVRAYQRAMSRLPQLIAIKLGLEFGQVSHNCVSHVLGTKLIGDAEAFHFRNEICFGAVAWREREGLSSSIHGKSPVKSRTKYS